MRRTHIFLIAGVAVLSVAMFGLNLKLHKMNGQIKAQLDRQMLLEEAARAPKPGWVMPVLHGQRMNGTDPAVDLQSSAPKITLLLFDTENCPACAQNWAFWDRLLADPDITHSFIAVTPNTVPSNFLDQHPLVKNHMIITQLDPSMVKQMRMQTTPQTIYMESGTVKKVWFGLLSDDEVKEISKTMQPED